MDLLEEAMELGLITDVQKDALLTKKRDREVLSMQDRNGLRALRIIQNNFVDDMERLAKDMIRRRKVAKLLSLVDTPKGIICYRCKKGAMIAGTISSRYEKDSFELILEHEPGRICLECNEAIFNDELVKRVELICREIEQVIAKLRGLKPENLSSKKCPLCMGETLKENQFGNEYRSQQGLFHFMLKQIPLLALCSQCGYKLLDDKSLDTINDLERNITMLSLELIKIPLDF